MVLYCREVGVWCRTGYSSMGPLCGLRVVQNASLTLNNPYHFFLKLIFFDPFEDDTTSVLLKGGANFLKARRSNLKQSVTVDLRAGLKGPQLRPIMRNPGSYLSCTVSFRRREKKCWGTKKCSGVARVNGVSCTHLSSLFRHRIRRYIPET